MNRFFIILGLVLAVQASYIPGLVPKEFRDGQKIEIMASNIESKHTHTQYEYYLGAEQCKPNDLKTHKIDFGEALAKEFWSEAPYKIEMGNNIRCQAICQAHVEKVDIDRFTVMGLQGFEYKLNIDDLPSATRYHGGGTTNTPEHKIIYSDSIPLISYKSADKIKIYNHLHLIIETHKTDQGTRRIVGFDVEPMSIDWSSINPCMGYWDPALNLTIDGAEKDLGQKYIFSHQPFYYSYSVEFVNSNLTWAHRLDHYKKLGNEKIHHSSILLSAGIVLLLSLVVCYILNRVMEKDFQALTRNFQRLKQNRIHNYNTLNTSESSELNILSTQHEFEPRLSKFADDMKLEVIGWKRISGEVFRRPYFALVLSMLVGSGAQVTTTLFLLIFYSTQSSFDPLHRKEIYYLAFFLTALFGMLAGYVSARFYKFFNGTSWLKCAIATALFIPSIFVIYSLVTDFIDWYERTLTVPITTLTEILALWVIFNIITIFIGSWAGFKAKKMEVPAKPSRIPRQLSETAKRAPFFTSPIFTVPIGSFICFACIGTETFYIVSSTWRENAYMMFPYLLLSLSLMAIVAAQVSIIQSYIMLKYERANWWWPAFFIGFSVSFWIFLISYEYYFFLGEGYGLGALIIFSGLSGVVSLAIGMVAGFFSFVGSYFMVKKMYAHRGSRVE